MQIQQYLTLLNLVAAIDQHLERGDRHFYARSGRLLTKLDQIVHAILADDLTTPNHHPARLIQCPYKNQTEAEGWPMFPEEV